MEAASATSPSSRSQPDPARPDRAGRGLPARAPDQLASFAARRQVGRPRGIGREFPSCSPRPGAGADATERAVFVEIPVDLLAGETAARPRRSGQSPSSPAPHPGENRARRAAVAERRRAPGRLGGRRRPPLGRVGRACRARAAARRSRGDDVHGQGRLPRGPPASRRLRLRRGRLQGAAGGGRRRAGASAPSSAPRRPASTRSSSRGRWFRSTPPERIGATFPAFGSRATRGRCSRSC